MLSSFKLNAIILFVLYTGIIGQHVNFTDVRHCKVTHSGRDFAGPIFRTRSGLRCQFWETATPIHTISAEIEDDDFPEGSKKLAKNYCRNPTEEEEGPWCYTMDATVIDDICDVPLCMYTECRLTGPGVEYSGKIRKTGTEEECLKWNDNDVSRGGGIKFENDRFPGDSRSDSGRRCRNPDGDPGGPWCYVEVERLGEDKIERRYCDIPFCDDQECMAYTDDDITHKPFHSHFTSFNISGTKNLTFALKLWNPEKWKFASVRLALSVVDTPGTGEDLASWGAGVELLISNNRSGFVAGIKKDDEEEEEEDEYLLQTPGFISGTHWSWFWVMWDGGFITLGHQGRKDPVSTEVYSQTTLLGQQDDFYYYSMIGTGVLWIVPSCEFSCESHTTSRNKFYRFIPLRNSETGHYVNFFVRSLNSALINLRVSPSVHYPSVTVTISKKNETSAFLFTKEKPEGILLQLKKDSNMLNYWKWAEFSVSIFGGKLSLFWTRDAETLNIIETSHDLIHSLRWFSISSEFSTAHWSLFCNPLEQHAVPDAVLPECAGSEADAHYQGTQRVTSTGIPCIPWTSPAAADISDLLFIDGNKINASNFCRNPTSEFIGPWCYGVEYSLSAKPSIRKTVCKIRKCRNQDCRMAGTGNDFVGRMNVTRSGRECQKWLVNSPHKVNEAYLNSTLFPERNLNLIENYCRDPSKNLAGPWCYTTDPSVPVDICAVYDCVMPENCTAYTHHAGEGRDIYILPIWRQRGFHFSLKEWDPNRTDGIVFVLRPENGTDYYRLVIGAEKNEKVYIEYHSKSKKKKLKEKTLPHLIPIGKWGSFWLKTSTGAVLLGYEGQDAPLFDWIATEPKYSFRPMFMSYASLIGHSIGVSFNCSHCHVEKTSISAFTKVLPIALGSRTRMANNFTIFTLFVRGQGTVLIPLMLQPGMGDYYAVTLGEIGGNKIYFVKQKNKVLKTLKAVEIPIQVLLQNEWVKINFMYNENSFIILRNNKFWLEYKSDDPMLFYFFTVSVENGEITWSANCEPPDIDGKPRDGGWSEWSNWQCSVTCGGGKGFVTRTCTNPEPNIRGKDCEGISMMEGSCNNFPCGEISPDTEEMLHNSLQTQHFNKEVMEGDYVKLECDSIAVEIITRESPEAEIEWTKNGLYIEEERGRLDIHSDYTIIIKHAEPNDTGVYTCSVFQINNVRAVIRFISLAVVPSSVNIVTRVSWPVILTCNSIVLGYTYDNLQQRWEVNGKVWKDFGVTVPAAVNTIAIPSLNKTDSGHWKCIVEQSALKFRWTTNWLRIKVKHKPNFLTYLMEDPLPAKIFGSFKDERMVLFVLIVIILVICLVAVVGAYFYLKITKLR